MEQRDGRNESDGRKLQPGQRAFPAQVFGEGRQGWRRSQAQPEQPSGARTGEAAKRPGGQGEGPVAVGDGRRDAFQAGQGPRWALAEKGQGQVDGVASRGPTTKRQGSIPGDIAQTSCHFV